MKRILPYILSLVAVACSDMTGPSEEAGDVGLSSYVDIGTKGTGGGRSYVFYLVGNKNSLTEDVVEFGTYLDDVEGQPLIPVEVDEDGKPVSGEYDSSKGLRAVNGGYKLFVASPAVEMEDVGDSHGLEGYFYTRNEEGVYVSDPVDVTVGGVYLSDDGGFQYVYDVSEQVLRQPRSSLKLKFACGSDIEQTTLRSINLRNFISKGHYIPVEKRFHYSDTDIIDEQQLYPTEGEGPLTVGKGDGMVMEAELDVDEYILSMNYGELDAEGKNRFPMPSLEIETGESETDVVTFTAALGWDFKPQHAYEFTIKINSVYVNMTVTVLPWTVKDEVGSEVDVPEIWQIEFPLTDGTINLLDWEKIEIQTGTIG